MRPRWKQVEFLSRAISAIYIDKQSSSSVEGAKYLSGFRQDNVYIEED